MLTQRHGLAMRTASAIVLLTFVKAIIVYGK